MYYIITDIDLNNHIFLDHGAPVNAVSKYYKVSYNILTVSCSCIFCLDLCYL